MVDKDHMKEIGKKKSDGTERELDVIAYYKKVFIVIEWTTEKSGSGSYTDDFDNFIIKVKKLREDEKSFNEYIDRINKRFSKSIKIDFSSARIIGMYINPTWDRNIVESITDRVPKDDKNKNIFVWGLDTFEYFNVICKTISRYSKYELFGYFDIKPELIFDAKELEGRKGAPKYRAIEIAKGVFDYPTYTFKIKPMLLLERCYVLRNDGWYSDSFQRMVMPDKLGNIRKYILDTSNPSFANNIIVSLSSEIKPEEVVIPSATDEERKEINLPYIFNSICIIDGQHRLLAFTQDFYGRKDKTETKNDEAIKKFAENSEIIVTLALFKGNRTKILKEQTKLFEDINSNQSKIKTEFLLNLKEITDPLSAEAIGNKVIKYLNYLDSGPFKDKVEVRNLPYYGGKIKRTSVVRWGLAELVDKNKSYLKKLYAKEVSEDNLNDYVRFCGDKMNLYFEIIKDVYTKKYKKDIWDYDGYMLSSSSAIVGFLRLYRHFIISDLTDSKDKEKIKERLDLINVKFDKEHYLFTSSQWSKLEAEMFKNITHRKKRKFTDFGDKNLVKTE
jgi:DGQHR domain-containing protein